MQASGQKSTHVLISLRSGSDGRGPPNGARRHRRIAGLISNPKQRRISQLAHLASPLLCAACAPPCASLRSRLPKWAVRNGLLDD